MTTYEEAITVYGLDPPEFEEGTPEAFYAKEKLWKLLDWLQDAENAIGRKTTLPNGQADAEQVAAAMTISSLIHLYAARTEMEVGD